MLAIFLFRPHRKHACRT